MSSRRVPIAIACLAVMALLACTRYRTPLRPEPEGRRVYKKQKPARLAPHVRPVYRISNEDPAERRRELQPDLADPEISDAREVAETEPQDAAAARRLVELLFQKGREMEALEQARAFRQRAPRDPDGALLMARIWLHLGDSQEALKSALEALRLDPLRSDAWVAVADAEFAGGRHRAAAEAFLGAIRLGAGEVDELRRAGLQFLEMEWWLEARDSLAAAREQGDRSPETILGLAAACLRLGQEAAAFEVLSVVYRPGEAWTQLGKLWMTSERWEEAHDSLVRALVLEPSGAEARVLMQMVDSHLPPPPVVTIPPFSDHSRARIELPAWTAEHEEPMPIVVAAFEEERSGPEEGLPAPRSDYRELPAPQPAGLILLRASRRNDSASPIEADSVDAATPSPDVLEVARLRKEGVTPPEMSAPLSLSGLLERLHVTDRLPPLVRDALGRERATGRGPHETGEGGPRARPEPPTGERAWLGWGSEPRAVTALSQLSRRRTARPPAEFRMLGLEPAFGPGSLNRDEPAEFPAILAVTGLVLFAGVSLSSRLRGAASGVVGAGLGLLAGSLVMTAMGIWHVV